MLKTNDIIPLPLTKADILQALQQALSQNFMDNLRNRPQAVQLDCKIRGYLGEIALRNWFASHNIQFEKSNYMLDGNDIDIDLAFGGKNKNLQLEIKTSMIPDSMANLGTSITRCDIKIIKRSTNISDLKGDLHLQIYFNMLRLERDLYLSKINVDWSNQENIYRGLHLSLYLNCIYFVGWIDKDTLSERLHKLPEHQRTWTFPKAQKDFWKCNILKEAHAPLNIIKYLENS